MYSIDPRPKANVVGEWAGWISAIHGQSDLVDCMVGSRGVRREETRPSEFVSVPTWVACGVV